MSKNKNEYKGETDENNEFRKSIFAYTEHENGNIEVIGLGEGDGSITLSKEGWKYVMSCLLPQI